MSAPAPRRRYTRWLRIAFGVGSFAALFLLCHPAEIVVAMEHAAPAWVAASFALVLLVQVLRTYRWWALLRAFGVRAPFAVLFEMMMVSFFFNLFLPGSVGGDAYRAFELARYSAKTLRPVATVVIERLTGVIALFVIAPVAILVAGDSLPVSPALILVLSVAALAAAVAVLVAGLQAERIYPRLRPLLPAALARRLPEAKLRIVFDVARDLRGKPAAFVQACATGVVLQFLVLTAYYAMALALHCRIPAAPFFSFFPIIEFVSLIPVTVNGLGVREGLTVWFLDRAGVPASFSMGLSILNRLITLAFGVLGGLILLLRRRPAPPQRPA